MRGLLAMATLALLALTGCETTQDRSSRLEAEAAKAGGSASLVADPVRRGKQVAIAKRTLLEDENGKAVVLELKNKRSRAVRNLPIRLELRGAGGDVVYSNAVKGLDRSLVSLAALPAGGSGFWIHDQLAVKGKTRTKVIVGDGSRVTGRLPKVSVSGVRLISDPDGTAATGRLVNRSKIDQRRIVVFAIARRKGRVVAAGTAQVKRLRARGKARFQMFFIGDPRRGRLSYFVPPTSVK